MIGSSKYLKPVLKTVSLSTLTFMFACGGSSSTKETTSEAIVDDTLNIQTIVETKEIEPEFNTQVEIGPSTYDALAECWLNNRSNGAYAKADKSSFKHGAKTYGMFQGGINEAMGYKGLTDCLAEIMGVKQSTYRDYLALEKKSGMKVVMKTPKDGAAFDYMNPAFIQWATENMVPNPEDAVLGAQMKDLYKGVFKRFFRMMAEGYWILNTQYKYKETCDSYAEAMATSTNMNSWVKDKVKTSLDKTYPDTNDMHMRAPAVLSFWLRRGIDGSSQELYNGLEKLLSMYDADFLKASKAKYKFEGASEA